MSKVMYGVQFSVEPPWAEGVMATDEQFAEWLLLLLPSEQVKVITQLRFTQAQGNECRAMDHQGRVEQLEAALVRVHGEFDRYRQAVQMAVANA